MDRPGNSSANPILPEVYTYSGALLSAVSSPRAVLSARASGMALDGDTTLFSYSGNVIIQGSARV